jgi:hypothetical protein
MKSTSNTRLAVALVLLVTMAAAAGMSDDGIKQGAHTASRSLLATPKCPTNMERNFQKKCVCSPGYELYTTTRKCHACLAGYYKPKRGSSKCLKCPSGQYVAKRGATKCLKCAGGLVDPTRVKCQSGCKNHNDHSVLRFGPFWSVNWHVYFRGGVTNKLTAAQVCDNLRNVDSSAINLIPAVIKSSAEAKVAAKLAEFHFACERKPEGQTNFDYAYFAWISKGYDAPYPPPSQCAYLFHTKGAQGDGSSSTLGSDQCVGDAGELLPVLCTKGCARYCKQCNSFGKCQSCLDGYRAVNGVCLRVELIS